MKTIILTMAAICAAAPAAAQPWQVQRSQSSQLQMQIDAGVRSGAISQRELPPLRESLRRLVMLERQFSVNGISGRERAALQQSGAGLRQQINLAERSNGRFDSDRAGWETRYDREHRAAWEERYLRDRSAAWESSDGRDDGYSSNGRFEISRSGDRFAGDARVGQRASRRMVALPEQYRDEFRDGDEVYYRYDSDRIYEIDRHSGVILRLFEFIG